MNAYTNYRNNQIRTASPEQLLIMLYDGAIRFVGQAEKGLADQDHLRKREAISRAMGILTELSNTLDHEVGGEIAGDLDALYHFMIRELIQANLQSDPEKLATVRGLLSDLRETWSQAIELRAGAGQEKIPQQAGIGGGAAG